MPSLPPRHGSTAPAKGALLGGSDGSGPGKARPAVPIKPRFLTRCDQGPSDHETPDIQLFQFNGEDASPKTLLQHVEPIAEPEESESGDSSSLTHANHDDQLLERPHAAKRSSSPLSAFSQGLGNLQVKKPDFFRAIPDGAQSVAKSLPQRFQGATGQVAKAAGAFQNEAPKVFRSAVSATQNAITGVGTGVKKALPKLHDPTHLSADIRDLTSLHIGNEGLCSHCSTLDLSMCFDQAAGTSQPYRYWTTPLSRVVLHKEWCALCRLLCKMLSRPQHDPLRSDEIKSHINPAWLRDVPFSEWVSKGYITKDEYWPFGRSHRNMAGATHLVKPMGRVAWQAVKTGYRLYSMEQARRQGDRSRFNNASSKVSRAKYARAALVAITVSTAHAEAPGLLLGELLGCSNREGAEEGVLSSFVLRAVTDRLTVRVRPGKPLTYGQVLDPQWVEPSLARLWLMDCETRHGKQCSEHGWAVAMQKPDFLRVIDVEKMCVVVVSNPHTCRYVALSYVWGNFPVLKLRYANADELSQPLGLQRNIRSLPRTVLDAMEVTRATGERYLWCDSLSILQENTAESREQIANMDRVYGSALFTIVASQGKDANAGLRGVRRRDGSEGEPRTVDQPVARLKGNLSVIAPFGPARGESATDVWDTRAWTFQERALSRRMLFFANGEMTWHCRGNVGREDMDALPAPYSVSPLHWLALRPRHLGVGMDNYWQDGSFEKTRNGRTHFVRSAVFEEYAKVVAQYSRREMSFEEDAVNALAGLLRIFSVAFGSETVSGLPTTLLDAALLWQPGSSVVRRDPRLGIPSWSWAGWKGGVQYPQPLQIKRDESEHMSSVEGVQPMMRYFMIDKNTGRLTPVNGHGRGLPLRDSDVPQEWEAHAPRSNCCDLAHTCTTPDPFDMDPKIVPHLNAQHLIFWCASSKFMVSDLNSPPCSVAGKAAVLDMDHNPVGVARFDNAAEHDSARTAFVLAPTEAILLAEAHDSALSEGFVDDRFGCYTLMLIQTDEMTGVARRRGLAWVAKPGWIASDPSLRLVCLG